MSSRVTDLHIAKNVPLPAPALLQAEIPRSDAQAEFVARSRETIASILFGSDLRLLVIVGPCSIHDTEAGLDAYTRNLPAHRRVVWTVCDFGGGLLPHLSLSAVQWAALVSLPVAAVLVVVQPSTRRSLRSLGSLGSLGC